MELIVKILNTITVWLSKQIEIRVEVVNATMPQISSHIPKRKKVKEEKDVLLYLNKGVPVMTHLFSAVRARTAIEVLQRGFRMQWASRKKIKIKKPPILN